MANVQPQPQQQPPPPQQPAPQPPAGGLPPAAGAHVTGQLARGQENCQKGGVSAFDPQDW